MNKCCEKCKAIGHPGKIGTPWCGEMGNCPCHSQEKEEATVDLMKQHMEKGQVFGDIFPAPEETTTSDWEERVRTDIEDLLDNDSHSMRIPSAVMFKDIQYIAERVLPIIAKERTLAKTEVILGALNSNNPVEWIKNYALYHGIALLPEQES